MKLFFQNLSSRSYVRWPSTNLDLSAFAIDRCIITNVDAGNLVSNMILFISILLLMLGCVGVMTKI